MGRRNLGEDKLVLLATRVPKKVSDYYRSQPVYTQLLRDVLVRYAEKHKRLMKRKAKED